MFSAPLTPPPQVGWSADTQTVSQPPRSYEQVVEEHVLKPIAAPRRLNCVTTNSTHAEHTTATAPKTAGKKPQKPLRPSLPKSLNKKAATGTTVLDVTKTLSSKNKQPKESSQTGSRSVTVYWDKSSSETSSPAGTPSPSTDSNSTQRPVPLPRIKSKKQPILAHKDQSIVKLSENSNTTSGCNEDTVSSNKYLEELLEVFSAENSGTDNHSNVQNKDADKMSTGNSQSVIRARIQAFENQVEEVAEPVKPLPQTRKPSIKPPVAAKPSVAAKPPFNADDFYENVSSTIPTPAPRPQPPKKPIGQSVKAELDAILSKGPALNRSRPSVLTKANSIHDEESPKVPPIPPTKPVKEPLQSNLNINNHNSTTLFEYGFEDNISNGPAESTVGEYEYIDIIPKGPEQTITRLYDTVDKTSNHFPFQPQQSIDSNAGSRQSVTRRPTTIRVPSKTASFSDAFEDNPPPLPVQIPVGNLNAAFKNRHSIASFPPQASFNNAPEPTLPPRRLTTSKTLPPRPPLTKSGPGRPPPPHLEASGRSSSLQWETHPKPQQPQRRGPVLPPRPNPGHRLYNKYTLQVPHGIADTDYNGSTGELSFQKNEVLLLLNEIDSNTFECQVGDQTGQVHKSRMKVITPLTPYITPSQGDNAMGSGNGLKVQAIHDFNAEGPGELGLRAGDIVTMVEQLDSEWYRGTCRGSTGFFPINYVKVLAESPKPPPERKVMKPAVSGPRCVARFDFDGEHSDELTFSEGDVIQLNAYMGQEWARGQLGTSTGIFPLNFVDVIEDLPPPPSQQQTHPTKIALPGMANSARPCPKVAQPAQASQSSAEWVVALYDFSGKAEGELSFLQGDHILITQHLDADWSCGRLNGREGLFPRTFVESATAGQTYSNQNGAAGGMKARALFDFTSDCEEELSLKAGDIVTNLESVDDEWFLGELRGKRALVPKNYVQVM